MKRVQKIMTARDAAIALGLTRQTINRRIQAGELKSTMLLDHRQYVIRRDEVEAIQAGKHEDYVPPEDDL